jgi:aerobic-type carbon monoxide dehydrogenase small subunit (CoxS/CutS family)
MMKLNVTLNGKKRTLEVASNAILIDVLRAAGLKSVKRGCGEGHCGACAVLIDGRPRNSCIVFAAHCEGSEILTVEGLGNHDHPHALQTAFVTHGATQCGYCNPGSLMAAKALLDHTPDPTEAQVREALDGNLCRCSGYVKRIAAVLDAAKDLKTAPKAKGGQN